MNLMEILKKIKVRSHNKYSCLCLKDFKVYEFEYSDETIDEEINKLKRLLKKLNKLFNCSNYILLEILTPESLKIENCKEFISRKGYKKYIGLLKDIDLKYVFQHCYSFTIYSLSFNYNFDDLPVENVISGYYIWCTDIGEVQIHFMSHMEDAVKTEIKNVFGNDSFY